MSEVKVPFGDDQGETATLLLAAAEETGDGAQAVRVEHGEGAGHFVTSEEIAKKAGVDYDDPEEEDDSEQEQPAKKTAAKKTAKKP